MAITWQQVELEQWWRTYGTCARGGTHSSLGGHVHRCYSADFIIRKIEGISASGTEG